MHTLLAGSEQMKAADRRAMPPGANALNYIFNYFGDAGMAAIGDEHKVVWVIDDQAHHLGKAVFSLTIDTDDAASTTPISLGEFAPRCRSTRGNTSLASAHPHSAMSRSVSMVESVGTLREFTQYWAPDQQRLRPPSRHWRNCIGLPLSGTAM